MTAGCVPVVYKSDGPWAVILEEQQGTCGFSHASADEAAEQIDSLETGEDLRGKIAKGYAESMEI